jgi:hypothetical protein
MDWRNPLSYLEVAGSFAPVIGFGAGQAWKSNAVQSGLAKFDAFTMKTGNTIKANLKKFKASWMENWENSGQENLIDTLEQIRKDFGFEDITKIEGVEGIYRVDIVDKSNDVIKRVRVMMDDYKGGSVGVNDMFGNSIIDRTQSNLTVELTKIHEGGHGFLSVNRTSPFPRSRATLKGFLYENSDLFRYTEEAVVEFGALVRKRKSISSKNDPLGQKRMSVAEAFDEARKFPLDKIDYQDGMKIVTPSSYKIDVKTTISQAVAITTFTGLSWYGAYKYSNYLTNKE